MTVINAAKFKEQCLHLIDHLNSEGLVITKHGKPVAKVIPIESSCAHLIGALRGKIHIKGNIFSTGLTWDADKGVLHAKRKHNRRKK